MNRIRINDLYLECIDIRDEYYFDFELRLTNKKSSAKEYETEDIPKILQILNIYGFKNCFAEVEVEVN